MVYVNPDPWDNAPAVVVDSDAPNNLAAIDQIAEWARDNGFIRVSNFHLDVVRRDGTLFYRALCYRVTEEDRAARQERRALIDANIARTPAAVLEAA